MSEAPSFFVPDVNPERQKAVYAEFAKRCNVAVPELRARIYSIEFHHDGVEWTATVGRQLTGVSHTKKRSRGQTVYSSQSHSDPAKVLAIFPGVPFHVVTDHRIVRDIHSAG